MRAPTNLVSVNCVGTGVLDRPLTQQNLRTVREAGPYAHRDRLCKIKELNKPEIVVRIKTSLHCRVQAGRFVLFYVLNLLLCAVVEHFEDFY